MKRSKNGVKDTLLSRTPPPPPGMNEFASKLWVKKCGDLKQMGKLRPAVLESLEAYCNVLSDMSRARDYMDKSWGQEVFFRYQKSYNEANKLQIQLAKEFGFLPSAKGTLAGPKVKKGFNLTSKNRDDAK